jgi:hypothetical protein
MKNNRKEKVICNICGKEVETNGWVETLEGKRIKCPLDYFANGAVLGAYIEMKGHRTCVDNVNNMVVIPNRFRLFMHSGEKND